MEIYSPEFWDVVWSKPYGRYNRHHQKIWDAILPYLKGKTCDLGCGPCSVYKDKNIDLVGVDQSSIAIQEAKKNYPRGKYIVSDILQTGFVDSFFDTVVMFGVLDYFDNWDDILREARRICKSNGKIIATLLNGFMGHDWSKYKHITGNWHLYIEE